MNWGWKLEDGSWKLGQTLPPYPQTLPLLTTYPETNQTLPLTNSAHQIQKSETEFVYLED